MKVLIVDDSMLIRRSLIKLLDQLDCSLQFAEAVNVSEGIRMMNEFKPDIAIIDIRVPGGSGYDVLEQAEKLEKPPVTMILTKYSSENFRARAMQLGANYFFDKSTEFQMVAKIIESQSIE